MPSSPSASPGKGVRIMGEHLDAQGRSIMRHLGRNVVLEERLIGEEFTLQAFVDGEHLVPMPLVQDHKRAYEGDVGPNTGGMGSYSLPDHMLPFVSRPDYEKALRIMQDMVAAMRAEGTPYRGILYGQFMNTADGPKVIEFNARFGDPEAMNVLSIIESDFTEIVQRIIDGDLSSSDVSFANKATVCKYVVPEGYPEAPKVGEPIVLGEYGDALLYCANVEERGGRLYTRTSGRLRLSGWADAGRGGVDSGEGSIIVSGRVFHRSDIGTRESLEKRCRHMRKSMKKDFLSISIWERRTEGIIADAIRLKQMKSDGVAHEYLRGKNLGMIFEKASTRTRVSFEAGMSDLGGHALFLNPQDMQLGRGEEIRDTARVLSRYLDAVMIRAYSHATIEEFARYSTIPVINGLSDRLHPCQVLADIMTLRERFGDLRGLKLAWVGDGNNVCNTWILSTPLTGMEVVVASPPRYRPEDGVVERARAAGGRVTILTEPEEAVRDADVLYTDIWVSMGDEHESTERLLAFQGYTIDSRLLELAVPGAPVMHCLPAHRGEEITDDVLEGPQSIVWDQAENRLHAQKALLVWLIRGGMPPEGLGTVLLTGLVGRSHRGPSVILFSPRTRPPDQSPDSCPPRREGEEAGLVKPQKTSKRADGFSGHQTMSEPVCRAPYSQMERYMQAGGKNDYYVCPLSGALFQTKAAYRPEPATAVDHARSGRGRSRISC